MVMSPTATAPLRWARRAVAALTRKRRPPMMTLSTLTTPLGRLTLNLAAFRRARATEWCHAWMTLMKGSARRTTRL